MMFGRGDHMLTHLTKALRTFPIFIGVGPSRVRPLAVEDAVKVLTAALIGDRLSGHTVGLVGPTELTFDEAAGLISLVIGKRRTFVTVPIQFHDVLARVAERLMTAPLISVAAVSLPKEEMLEPALAPDTIPNDLRPSTPFDEGTVESRLSGQRRFGLRDLRGFERRPPFVVCGEGTASIRRTPRDILEFVLDVDRYRRADLKIGRVHHVYREGNKGMVRHNGRLLGLPTPAVTLSFELTPHSRLDFNGLAVPWPLEAFEGSFTCEEGAEGTRVVHRDCFRFGPLIGRLFEVVFGGWLARDTPAEVQRMKSILEAEAGMSRA
jgi:polyketide cyclase/dehydrase/lipid transport protein